MDDDVISEAMARARANVRLWLDRPKDDEYPIELRNQLATECFQLVSAGVALRSAARQVAEQAPVPVFGGQVVRWVRQRYPVDAILYATRKSAAAISSVIARSFGLAEQRAMNTMMLREANRRIGEAVKDKKTPVSDLSILALMAKRLIDIDAALDKRGAALDEPVSEDDALTAAQLLEETKQQAIANFNATKERLRIVGRAEAG